MPDPVNTPITTHDAAVAWRPDVTTFAAEDVLAEALIITETENAGTVDGDAPAVRVAYIKDDDAEFVAEGADPGDANPELSEVTVHTAKIMQLIPMTNEQFYQAGTEQRLSSSAVRALTKKADEAFLAQPAPVGGAVAPPAGLVNVSGITTGDPVFGSLDALTDLLAELEANGAAPSRIVLDPLGWAQIRKMKIGDDYNSTLLGAGTDDAPQRLLGVPVVVNRFAPPLTGVVIDRSAVVSAIGPVGIATSDQALFRTDSTLIRVNWRIGWSCVRAERIGKFTVVGDGS